MADPTDITALIFDTSGSGFPYPSVPGEGVEEDPSFLGSVGNASGISFEAEPGDVLLVWNKDSGNHDVTLYPATNARGRDAADNLTFTLGANEGAVLGPFPLDGWYFTEKLTDHGYGVNAAAADPAEAEHIEFAVIRFKNPPR